MFETISTKDMCREKWLMLRKTGIGGSEAGAVCGLSRFQSAASIYLDKISDEIKEFDNESMRIGRDLENYVACRFTEETGKKVRRSNKMYRSTRYPFMLADVDRLIVGEDAGLEIKTVSPYAADEWKDGAIPMNYLCQIMHYMIVLDKKVWYIAALIMGREFVWRRVEWDDALATYIIEREFGFWNHHVLLRVFPEPDGSDSYDEALALAFQGTEEMEPVDISSFSDQLEEREQLNGQIAELEARKKQIDQEIKLHMGNHIRASGGGFRVSWSEVVSSRLDTKRLKELEPETYNRFKTESRYRKFEVKAA